MEILFLADKLNLQRGGSNFSLHLMSELLARKGNDVRLVTLNFIHEENVLPDDPSYEVIEDPVGGGSRIARARTVYERLGEYDGTADVIHAFNPAIHPIAGRFRGSQGETPIVGRLNTYDTFCTNLNVISDGCYEHCSTRKKFRHSTAEVGDKLSSLPKYVFDTFAAPRLISNLDALFAISPAVKEIFGAIGVDERRIEVVPNFYDPGFVEEPPTGADVFEGDAFSLLYVGRLEPQKGLGVLLEAADRLPDGAYSVEIVGTGSGRSRLEETAELSGISDDVTFHGYVDNEDLPAYYASADAFVHPGRWPEPFGRTLLEAAQCGCPQIVSDVGGPPWIVEESGLVFETEDAEALADRIDRVARDDAVREDLVEGCERTLARFDPEVVVDEIESRYARLVEGAPDGGTHSPV